MPKTEPFGHPLPPDCLRSHIAILGKTGSGKTYTARGIAEQLLRDGRRVCIIDPTGAWWGLKSSADGESAGFPVVVFGGEHADVPISEHAGGALGELIGTSNLPAIIDLSGTFLSERRRFMTSFAEHLYRTNKAPLHLIIDEADEFSPQSSGGGGEKGMEQLIGHMDRIVRRGRSRGFRVMLITQRAAVLNKNVLTQCNTLIAMRTPAPQDRKAVEEWIKGQADDEQGKEVLKSLSKLSRGEGWIWAPEQGLLQRTQFPANTTFDSGRTPEDGEAVQAPTTLAEIDLSKITAALHEATEEAKANDPKALREKVRELEDELAAQRAMGNGHQAIGETDQTRERELAEENDRLREDLANRDTFIETVQSWLNDRTVQFTRLAEAFNDFPRVPERRAELSALLSAPSPGGSRLGEVAASAGEGSANFSPSRTLSPPLAHARVSFEPSTNGHAKPEGISGGMQRILDAIAWWSSIGERRPVREAVATVAGYTASAGGFRNYLGSLRTMGMIEYPGEGCVALTDVGRKVANRSIGPRNLGELHRSVLGRLAGGEAKILEAVIKAFPKSVTRDHLGKATGYEPTAGGFRNYLGHLRTLGLIDYPSQGHVTAAAILFPKGLH